MTTLVAVTKKSVLMWLIGFFLLSSLSAIAKPAQPVLSDKDYFEAQGLNILVFSNWYDGLFSDAKISGVEMIHHGERTVTNGDVRLQITPEQWDPIPQFVERKVDLKNGAIEAFLRYPDYSFDYSIRVQQLKDGVRLTVNLQKQLPKALTGRAGFNLEFLPAAYFEKTFAMDGRAGLFPLYPGGLKEINDTVQPVPLASGKNLVLAPDDPMRRISIASAGELRLYDGRTKAQNGWFVVRSLIPSGKKGVVIDWHISANVQPDWVRPPVIAHSQVGYHPEQEKIAIIELDSNDTPKGEARLLKVTDGDPVEAFKGDTKPWGKYLRYNYLTFDFSSVRDSGVYLIEYAGARTAPFRIAPDVYAAAWQPTLDVFFPVQMDHVLVNEAYRVWHGASHLDDALQAPVNHEHFDLYAQGPATETQYKPGEHVPGLNIGGWYDAGDYDIRTQSIYATVMGLVNIWESFRPARDATAVDYARKHVELHVADGKPDLLQQIEHGALALITQHRAFGRAVPGIVESDLSQYTHLGDAVTKTDNVVNERKGLKSDDRWVFTSYSSALNYGSIAALAAASRALKGYNDTLATECAAAAIKGWTTEQAQQPKMFHHGNTTGGELKDEMFRAAVELLITFHDSRYIKAVGELLPKIEEHFALNAVSAIKALPYMDEAYAANVKNMAQGYKGRMDQLHGENPFGVPITTTGWAGNSFVLYFAISNYYLHKAFPDLIGPESVFQGLNYLYGAHPASDLSFISGVGTRSKLIAYGSNRADFSFIAGGVVPGVLVIKPDFPENKENWPFFWGENEYVITLGAPYIFLVHAVQELLSAPASK
ncbi:MAG TPA: glycoside hydrolase family 9 protein [Gammaproteobacteria bacterium]|nr:glycoside hydrolase family 9 protein [Gammaproteobacteria bacterium]